VENKTHDNFYVILRPDSLMIVKGVKQCTIYDAIILDRNDPVLWEVSRRIDVSIDDVVKLLCAFYKFVPRQPERLSEKTSKEDAIV
jgi:hypothetical protein